MIDLTLIVLGNNNETRQDKNVEIIYTNEFDKIIDSVKKAKGKYIVFLKEEDNISKNYLETVLKKSKEEFDCCFINYEIIYEYKNKIKLSTTENELNKNKPYYGEYIWSFIFNKEKIITLLSNTKKIGFNKRVDEIFKKVTAIGKIIYFHNPKRKKIIKNFPYIDIKRELVFDNIIYVGMGCSGKFNGYVSWVRNIGKCFGKKYKIALLYDEMREDTIQEFSQYFSCIKLLNDTNYICDRLCTTYSNYFYPKNIIPLERNYLFIHGNMSDYNNSRKYYDNIYTDYVAVSEIAEKKAKGYFPTNNIYHIINPIKIGDRLKPHLKLTSAFKYSKIKRPDRIELMAKILNELDIPYTWNVFTDTKENTNESGGLIFRKRVSNPIPYINDSDYFVHLSDSEAMPYCIMEALSVNTKVVVTPLEAYNELGLENNKNAIIIPFDYFEEKNRDKLKEIIIKMYKKKKKNVNYYIDEKLWSGYKNVFK